MLASVEEHLNVGEVQPVHLFRLRGEGNLFGEGGGGGVKEKNNCSMHS